MRVLVVNAGSSSVKLRRLGPDDTVLGSADLPALDPAARGGPLGGLSSADGPPDVTALGAAIAELGEVDAVGHRVVHGGLAHRTAVALDDAVISDLEALTDLAPLHQPAAIAAIRAARAITPSIPHVACFDTAFHATLPDATATYALPAAWRDRWPLRRFGFHGLSHAYAARRATELLGRPADDLRLVTCHLGAGASLAAVAGGRSIDTTMGFSPLDGLVMATRSGSVDPGLVLWLAERGGLAVTEIAAGLETESGLAGLAGTADMRAVLAGAADGEAPAVLARDVYVHRLRAGIAAMTAALGGLDALVFTGGVGERSPEIRTRAVDGLGFLGVAIDRAANERAAGGGSATDAEIGPAGHDPRVLAVTSREDLEIARQVRATLAA